MSVLAERVEDVTGAGVPVEHLRAALPLPAGPRVIVAEDDALLRGRMISELRADGYTVVEAKSAKDLFDQVRASLRREGGGEPFAVIVSDARTPNASGMDLLFGLRSVAGATPIILVAASTEGLVLENAKRVRGLTILEEPVDVDELRLAVRRVVGQA